MNRLALSLQHFLAEEAGYDMVEFAMGAALLGSVGAVALKDRIPVVGEAVQTVVTFFHQSH